LNQMTEIVISEHFFMIWYNMTWFVDSNNIEKIKIG
jgi:hypothetical protein